MNFELYVHIPFCMRKCGYCDFLSFPAGEDVQLRYLDALQEEIRQAGKFVRMTQKGMSVLNHGAVAVNVPDVFSAADGGSMPDDCRSPGARQTKGRQLEVDTIFIGGGTPSLLPAEAIAELLQQIRTNFRIASDAEITIEANPGTVDAGKLAALRAAGINRLSLGCQSLKDRELKRMGRIHSRAEFLRSYEDARTAGFTNINVDLISGLPGQTRADWAGTLREAAALNPEHISAYSLILEEGTPFDQQRDQLDLPDEDTERAIYEDTAEILQRFGYEQYELSNYAKPGYACRHNLGYWTGIPYLGLGLGASSYWADAGGNGRFRFRRTPELQTYLDTFLTDACFMTAVEEVEHLSARDQMAEYMILGLRLTEGVAPDDFRRQFGTELADVFGDVIRKYLQYGLLEKSGGRIALTRRGRSLANVVMAEFL